MCPHRFLAMMLAAVGLCWAADRPSPESVARGQKLFVQACGFCHGNDATGSRAPDLIRAPSVNHDEKGSVIGPIIRNGRPDKGMPAFPFSDTQIGDIAAFLHAQTLAALNSNRVTGEYPLAKLLTGNSRAGESFFKGSGGCAACHSTTGDLAGIAKKLRPLDLQQRMLYPAGAKSHATVTLRSGEKITGTVTHIDEFNVALKDSSGWYRSWPRDSVQVEVQDPLEAHRKLLSRYSDTDVHNLFAFLETLK